MSLTVKPAEFIRIKDAPVPPNSEVFFLQTADEARLRVARFPVENARGTFFLAHGRCEFIEKYFEVVEDLRSRGFNVVTMDWRGQGLSSRMLPRSDKGYIKSFGTYRADLDLVLETMVLPEFEGPYFGLAHSMGSLPLLNLLSEGEGMMSGAVFCAPYTAIYGSPFYRMFARVASVIGVRVGAGQRSIIGMRERRMEFDGNRLTHSEKRHSIFRKLQEAAPNAAIFAPTYAWLKAATDATGWLRRRDALANIAAPVLIIGAGDDRRVHTGHTSRIAKRYDKVDFACVPGALHEIMMETDQYRDQFWALFDNYIEKRLAVMSVGQNQIAAE